MWFLDWGDRWSREKTHPTHFARHNSQPEGAPSFLGAFAAVCLLHTAFCFLWPLISAFPFTIHHLPFNHHA